MSKKIASILMSLVLCVSLISCGNGKTEDEAAKENNTAQEQQKTDATDAYLTGEWAEDRTLDELKTVFDEKLTNVEKITKDTGLKYSLDEKIKKIDGQQVTEKAIYFDNENPEMNKMESMYFGLKIYGEDLSSGEIQLKLSLKFDSKDAIESGKFDLGETAFAKYIEAFTGEENKDYSNINNTIIEQMKSGQEEVIVSNTTKDGLKEEYLADKDYIVYKLSTKKYVFANAEMSME